MAKKIKCDDCHELHGGFHLCIGPVELPKRKGKNYRSLQDKVEGVLAARWEATAERDQDILEDYSNGVPMRKMVDTYRISGKQIRSVVSRLGGTLRPVGTISNLMHYKENS